MYLLVAIIPFGTEERYRGIDMPQTADTAPLVVVVMILG